MGGCLTFDNKDKQHQVSAVPRPGNAPAKQGIRGC